MVLWCNGALFAIGLSPGPSTMGLSTSPAPPSRGLGPGPPLRTLLQTRIQTMDPPDSKAGLFPVRSPLLRKSFHFCLQKKHRFPRRTSRMGREEQVVDLRIPWRISRWGRGEGARTEYRRTPPVRTPQLLNTIADCSTV
ncbi:hypothetical protein T459_34328 [Capsicum annuum]|uniref:Uncharacterized protein n=1 Tax=Capsicum annuum TaxID=4072 RepID=A0A2G2XWK3_CAPAN|nr:hypothetical protein T459_34328 [Capsicum annuum]